MRKNYTNFALIKDCDFWSKFLQEYRRNPKYHSQLETESGNACHYPKRGSALDQVYLIGRHEPISSYKEVEYAVAANHRNHRFATEALSAMLEYTFSERDTEVVAAWVRSFNNESVRVLEKCHFTHEGTLRKHARDRGDTLCYSILKEEWMEHQIKNPSNDSQAH